MISAQFRVCVSGVYIVCVSVYVVCVCMCKCQWICELRFLALCCLIEQFLAFCLSADTEGSLAWLCVLHDTHTPYIHRFFHFISPHWACACDNVCDVCDLLNYLISISWSAPLFSFYTPNSPSSTLAPTAAAKNRLCLPFEFHTKFEFAINNFSRTNDVYECVVCAHRRTGINRKKTHIYTTWEYVKMYTQAAAVCCTAKCRMRQSFGSVALFSSFLVFLHFFF